MNALALANHLWQSTLFAAGMGLMTLAFRRNAAAVRHALWLAASIKFLVPFAALMTLGSHLGLRAPVRLVQHEVVVATTAVLPLSPFDASPMTSAPVSSLGAAALPWLAVTLWVAGSLLVSERGGSGGGGSRRSPAPRRLSNAATKWTRCAASNDGSASGGPSPWSRPMPRWSRVCSASCDRCCCGRGRLAGI